MAIRTFIYPSNSIDASNPSVSDVAATAPSSATLVGATDNSGDLRGLTTTLVGSDYSLDVNVTQSALPSGAATAARQDTGNASLATIEDTVGATGAAVPTKAILVGGNDDGDLTALSVDGSGFVNVNAVNAVVNTNIQNVNGNVCSSNNGTVNDGTLRVTIASDSTGTVAATQSGSWTSTVTQGTAANLNMTDATGALIQGSKAAGTAATNSALVGGVYNTTAPTLTDGQQVALQVDETGSLFTTLPDTFIAGEAGQSGTINNIIPTTAGASGTDASNFRSASIQVVSSATGGTLNFECSNDGTNWEVQPIIRNDLTSGAPIAVGITATATNRIYTFSVVSKYIRLRLQAVSGGTVQAFTRLSQESWEPTLFSVAQSTAANLLTTSQIKDSSGNNLNSTSNALNVQVQNSTQAVTQSGTWTVQPGNTANTTAWLVTQRTSSTGTITSVNDTDSSTTVLASNSSRLGAMFFNDSTASLYLKLGATASATSFTVLIPPQGYFELPANPACYTGVIDGIWSSNASGAVRVTELT